MENQYTSSNQIQQTLQYILDNFQTSKNTEQFNSNNSIWKKFEELVRTINKSKLIQDYPNIKVEWSIGRGNWARVPWIAFLDNRETNTTQSGIYGVFLFREDMSGVYITYNQGVTRILNEYGAREGRKILQEKAN